MAAMLSARVERSLIPGLLRVPITRSPCGLPSAAAASPWFSELPEFEFVEPSSSDSSGACDAVAAATSDSSGAASPQVCGAQKVGGNLILGGAYGFLSRLLRPRLDQLAQRSGSWGAAVKIIGETGAFSLAYGVSVLSKEMATKLGSAMMRVPLLGGMGIVGQSLQFSLAVLVGEKLVESLAVQSLEDAPPDVADPVFLSNMCVMCNTPFAVGGGQKVAALSCGHACMCNEADCVTTYLQQRGDCPLCRTPCVHVMHELRV
mmetsp:Transcript_12869/g.23042  ORF Transcript_12869/g.23042 Transcript_12869/m.23042 type:complete len:261 (-) Transcript_12869:52-834(-)